MIEALPCGHEDASTQTELAAYRLRLEPDCLVLKRSDGVADSRLSNMELLSARMEHMLTRPRLVIHYGNSSRLHVRHTLSLAIHRSRRRMAAELAAEINARARDARAFRRHARFHGL